MMDELLVKYLADEATPPEQEEVEAWISESEANRDYFNHFQMIWNGSGEFAVGNSADENKAWQKFQRRMKKDVPADASKSRFGWWRIAAAIVLIAGITWFVSTTISSRVEVEHISLVAANEVRTGLLPDGSVATLNKNTVLSYPSAFKGDERKVKLKGEAFFDIKPNREKPFIIDVNDVRVKVVGTSFNIKSYNGATEIIVETGIVQVTKNNKTVELRAGERTTLGPATGQGVKEKSDDKLYNYYISKTFVCDNTPLWKLVEKLNEAYDVDIKIDRPALRKLPLNVTFDEESLDTILDIISQTLMIKYSRDGDDIRLY
jgi:ferric-dicitrate binding protein FerR (iron transport regulator)